MAQSSEIESEIMTNGDENLESPETFHKMDDNEESKSDSNKKVKPEEDLEDGEIESDDDEVVITSIRSDSTSNQNTKIENQKAQPKKTDSTEKPAKACSSSRKSRRSAGDMEDWAENVEKAIAAMLKKKDGSDPARPDFKRRDECTEEPAPKSKNRKRKKHDNREKNKKKRTQEEQNIESDIDESELLCVRGASPTHTSRLSAFTEEMPLYFDSDSYQSSESTESMHRKSYDERRAYRRMRDRRYRHLKERDKKHALDEPETVCVKHMRGACNNEDCPHSHISRPTRKMELCKFYLMECCAKKDKCLYMHSEFPCKYYYLGMECIYKNKCKFLHGEPLSEDLRTILLKHIETAPKEILGNFRRISRENAVHLLNITHAKLCAEHGIENTFASSSSTATSTTTSTFSSPAKSSTNNSSTSDQTASIPSLLDMVIKPPISPRKNDKELKNEKRKSRWCDTQSSSNMPNMSVPPPNMAQTLQSSSTISSNNATSFLSLKNLTGVITPEQIEKLEALGIENLDQVSHLTVGQLNTIGLTISQINEIQLNALNIQKLGLISGSPAGINNNENASCVSIASTPLNSALSNSSKISLPNSVSNQDVDMRFVDSPPKAKTALHSSIDTTEGTSTTTMTSPEIKSLPSMSITDTDIASPEPIPNSGKLIQSTSMIESESTLEKFSTISIPSSTIDYSQYLKDAHISLDKDDDISAIEDEPELLIDESWCPSDEEGSKAEKRNDDENEDQNVDDWGIKDTEENKRQSVNIEADENKEIIEEEEDWSEIKVPAQRIPKRIHGEENWDDDIDQPSKDQEQEIPKRNHGEENWDEAQPSNVPSQRVPKRIHGEENWDDDIDQPSTSYSDQIYNERNDYEKDINKEEKWSNTIGRESRGFYSRESQNQDEGNWESRYKRQKQNFYQSYEYESSNKEEEMWDDDLDNNKQDNQSESQKPQPALLPAIYDPKTLYLPSISSISKIDVSSSVSNMMASSMTNQSYADSNKSTGLPFKSGTESREFRDPRLNKSLIPGSEEVNGSKTSGQNKSNTDSLKYERISIYDGNTKLGDEDSLGALDTDLVPGIFLDCTKGDAEADLRLPFKRVMTNYTPATEIDGSISSHSPIPYRVVLIDIPKPDYSEIRKSFPITDKTLDPRLRRIFCLKESVDGESEVQYLSGVNKQTDTERIAAASLIGGPRGDPRRKKENLDVFATTSQTSTVTSAMAQPTATNKSLDVRMILQKSDWYKNLNSKVKIMVNQQLALVSTELKKFHQDPSPNKVFDIQFIVTNHYLQQILTNLGIYIDDYGEVRQLENESDTESNNTLMPLRMNMGMNMPMMDPSGLGMPPMIPMEFLRNPPPMAMSQRFIGGGMQYNGPKPGLLGIAPGVGYSPYDLNTNCVEQNFPPMTPGGGGYEDQGYGNESPRYNTGNNFQSSGNFFRGNVNRKNENSTGRGNRNFRASGANSRSNERWTGNSSGSRNDSNRRNYENRGRGNRERGNDQRRDKM